MAVAGGLASTRRRTCRRWPGWPAPRRERVQGQVGGHPDGVAGERSMAVSIAVSHSSSRRASQSSTLALRPATTSISRPRSRSTKLVAKVVWRRRFGPREAHLLEAEGATGARPPGSSTRGCAVVGHGRHHGRPAHAERAGHAGHRAVLLAHPATRTRPGPARSSTPLARWPEIARSSCPPRRREQGTARCGSITPPRHDRPPAGPSIPLASRSRRSPPWW